MAYLLIREWIWPSCPKCSWWRLRSQNFLAHVFHLKATMTIPQHTQLLHTYSHRMHVYLDRFRNKTDNPIKKPTTMAIITTPTTANTIIAHSGRPWACRLWSRIVIITVQVKLMSQYCSRSISLPEHTLDVSKFEVTVITNSVQSVLHLSSWMKFMHLFHLCVLNY